MKSKFTRLILLLILLPMFTLTSYSCCCSGGGSTFNCEKQGSHSLFAADFNSDAVGSMPAPSTPLHYGPPGASLNMKGSAGTIEVVNSNVLGSKALKLTRGAPDSTEVNAVIGDIGDAPYTTGVYYNDFTAYGQVIPSHFIAGMEISVRSKNNKAALILRLYDGSYHLKEGDSYVQISGTYNPDTAHNIHIELNLNTRKYSICIDDEVVILNKALLVNDFDELHTLHYFLAPTITEAFQSIYITDDIRITK